MADQRIFEPGTRVKLLVNWQSFVDWGFLTRWKKSFFQAIHNSCQAWNNIGGTSLRFSTITEISVSPSIWDLNTGELVIDMGEAILSSDNILALGGGNFPDGTPIRGRSKITFYCKNHNLTPYKWTVAHADPVENEKDFQAVLIHELGHACGLEHSSNDDEIMYEGYKVSDRYGPFMEDIERLRALYPNFVNNRLKSSYYNHNNQTWYDRDNNLTTHNTVAQQQHVTRSNHKIGVTDIHNTPLYLLAWNNPNFQLNTCFGDGIEFLKKRNWTIYYPDTVKSIYGPQLAQDEHGNVLWVWVNHQHKIKCFRSTDNGMRWTVLNSLPDNKTGSTPGLCCIIVNNIPTWIICWVNLTRGKTYDSHLGKIKYTVSQDNGATWSAPQVLNENYPFCVQGGLSISAADKDHIIILFTQAPINVGEERLNMIQGFGCHLNGTQLNIDRLYSDTSTNRTDCEPGITYKPSINLFMVVFKDSTSNNIEKGRLKSLILSPQNSAVGMPVPLSFYSNNAPTLQFSKRYLEIVLWYPEES